MDGHPTVTVVAAWVKSADPILSVTRTTDILLRVVVVEAFMGKSLAVLILNAVLNKLSLCRCRRAVMLTVLGGLAEFERELIIARTGEGRKRAQARGVRFGQCSPASRGYRASALWRDTG